MYEEGNLFGGTERVFTVIREGWREDERREVKGGIVAAEQGEGWRGNAAGVHTQRN